MTETKEIVKDLIETGIINQTTTIEVKENAIEVEVGAEIETKKEANTEGILDLDLLRIKSFEF